METYITIFIVAMLGGALFTPLARRVAFRFGVVSAPGGRHIHGRAIPRLGGLGIYAASMATIAGMFALRGRQLHGLGELLTPAQQYMAVGLIAGGTLMFGLGVFDDVKGLRAVNKLAVQIAAAIIAWAFGFRIDVIDLPLMEPMSMGIFSLPVTVFWVVGIVNAVNLIDGLDGLAAGVVFFAAITNFVVAWLMGTTLVALVMATIAGAVLGFLFFNFNPARIFMGDSGSYFLGFVLALCSIAGPLQKASAAVSIAVPLVALGVPAIDTLLAMVRRVLERRPIFSPDRGHIHHRLLDMGITHRRAVLIIYGVTVALCVASIAIAFGRQWQVGAAILGVSALLFGLIRFIGYFEYLAVLGRQKQRIHSRHVEWLRKAILKAPERFRMVRDEDGVFAVLQWLAQEAKWHAVELRAAKQTVTRWKGNDYEDMDARDVTMANFPLSAEGVELKFSWKSEFGDVPPQMEILLQLVVDQVEESLGRVESRYVRRKQLETDTDVAPEAGSTLATQRAV